MVKCDIWNKRNNKSEKINNYPIQFKIIRVSKGTFNFLNFAYFNDLFEYNSDQSE